MLVNPLLETTSRPPEPAPRKRRSAVDELFEEEFGDDSHRRLRSAGRRVKDQAQRATQGSRSSLYEQARKRAGMAVEAGRRNAGGARGGRMSGEEIGRSQPHSRAQQESAGKNARAREIARRKFGNNPQMANLLETVLADDTPGFVLEEKSAELGPTIAGGAPDDAFDAIAGEFKDVWNKIAGTDKIAEAEQRRQMMLEQRQRQSTHDVSRFGEATRFAEQRVPTQRVIEFDPDLPMEAPDEFDDAVPVSSDLSSGGFDGSGEKVVEVEGANYSIPPLSEDSDLDDEFDRIDSET